MSPPRGAHQEMNFNQLLQTPNAPQPMQAWAVNKGSHQRSAAVGRDLFILRYTLFPKKGILAACNRNVNQTVNLPARPWPALPMLTRVSRDKNNKKKKVQNPNCTTAFYRACGRAHFLHCCTSSG